MRFVVVLLFVITSSAATGQGPILVYPSPPEPVAFYHPFGMRVVIADPQQVSVMEYRGMTVVPRRGLLPRLKTFILGPRMVHFYTPRSNE